MRRCTGKTAVRAELKVCTRVIRVFRYVDDFLILFLPKPGQSRVLSCDIVTIFENTLRDFTLTYEFPSENSLTLLDCTYVFRHDHVCCKYAPRSKKSLLPYTSANSKSVKRGIALSTMRNALERSCPHGVQDSFEDEIARLIDAGFSCELLSALAETLMNNAHHAQGGKGAPSIAVMPYVHSVSHRIRKAGGRVGVRVVFYSVPGKLSVMCGRVNSGPVNNKNAAKNMPIALGSV